MTKLTEERVREIAREEIRKHSQRQVEIHFPPHNLDELKRLTKPQKMSRKRVVK